MSAVNPLECYTDAIEALASAIRERDFRRFRQAQRALSDYANQVRQALADGQLDPDVQSPVIARARTSLDALARILREWQAEIDCELTDTRRRRRRTHNLNRSYRPAASCGSRVSFRR